MQQLLYVQIDEFYEKIVSELGIGDVTSMVASVHKANVSRVLACCWVLFVTCSCSSLLHARPRPTSTKRPTR